MVKNHSLTFWYWSLNQQQRHLCFLKWKDRRLEVTQIYQRKRLLSKQNQIWTLKLPLRKFKILTQFTTILREYQVHYHRVEVILLPTSNIQLTKESNLKKKTITLTLRMHSVIYKAFKEIFLLMTTMTTIDLNLTQYNSLNHDLTTIN